MGLFVVPPLYRDIFNNDPKIKSRRPRSVRVIEWEIAIKDVEGKAIDPQLKNLGLVLSEVIHIGLAVISDDCSMTRTESDWTVPR
jgi:hypothetical protein